MTPDEKEREISAETTLPKLKKEFPQAKIGIIDALPPKGIPYAEPYKDLLEKSRNSDPVYSC